MKQNTLFFLIPTFFAALLLSGAGLWGSTGNACPGAGDSVSVVPSVLPTGSTDLNNDVDADVITAVTETEFEADFEWHPESPMRGESVKFRDTSRPEGRGWHWDFGDSRESTERNPTHRFLEEGTYTVTLTVFFDNTGTISRSVSHDVRVAGEPLAAEFFWFPIKPRSGEEVEFHSSSNGNPSSWSWDFGDGEGSTEENPVHVFANPGDYIVTLIIRGGPDGGASDTVEHTVHVKDLDIIDFSWSPEEPVAREPIRFSPEGVDTPASFFWNFGDGESSREFQPTHIFPRPGHFTVQLWVSGNDGVIFASAEHDIEIGQPDLEPVVIASNGTPEIGEDVQFTITGLEGFPGQIGAVEWNFGGLSCDGSSRIQTCVPGGDDDCMTGSFNYSIPGIKAVRAKIQIDNTELGPLTASVDVQHEGQCSNGPQADFNWWPVDPLQGQRIRFVDRSTGGPDTWSWSFDDGTTASSRHPVKVFNEVGDHQVSLEVSSDQGSSMLTRTVRIAAVAAECGNSVCEPGENNWNCHADCGDGRGDATGRTGRKNTSFAVPAAAGGIPGANDTYWLTEGSIINPGSEETGVIIQFFPDLSPDHPLSAGPKVFPPHTALHFDNIVEEVFGIHELGALLIDSSKPVLVNTRTYNRTADGTYGQAIGGISRQDVLGRDDGLFYLIGLDQNESFRTNILFQEVSGKPAGAEISIRDAEGTPLVSTEIFVAGFSRWQHPLSALGIGSLEGGYAVISVEGEGKLAVIASKIDQLSGDATTVDTIHRGQMDFHSNEKAGEITEHFLVAVVARSPGANQSLWRSEVSVLNPEDEEQQIELRYQPGGGEMQSVTLQLDAGSVFSTPDILANFFPEAGDGSGSLHIYSDKALAVSSRTYNLLPTDATVGQSIPGLSSGDMARPGEVWLLDSLREDSEYRCNLGFAEYEGNDAEVTVVLFDTSAMAQRYLGYKVYPVAAFSQAQVNHVFSDFGIEGEVPQSMAYISISSAKGAVYCYASIIDNAIGDGTTILAKRQ